jgi:DNA ligase-1
MKPMLAKSYEGQSVKGWMMSEKLDGVRAIWDGEKLASRNGNQFFAPEWFTSQLPGGIALDGELFIGRGRFQATVSVVKKKSPVDSEWNQIRYCVFDAPQAAGGFEDRLAFCDTALARSSVASVVPHRECTGNQDMEQFFEELCAAGAEGIMLRAPGSRYENRRSANLLKYKPFESDEAEMVGSEIGEGRLAGLVGALIVKWGKITFRVGSGLSDEVRMNPPKVGSLISFGFCGLTDGGCPRFPTFLAERSYE